MQLLELQLQRRLLGPVSITGHFRMKSKTKIYQELLNILEHTAIPKISFKLSSASLCPRYIPDLRNPLKIPRSLSTVACTFCSNYSQRLERTGRTKGNKKGMSSFQYVETSPIHLLTTGYHLNHRPISSDFILNMGIPYGRITVKITQNFEAMYFPGIGVIAHVFTFTPTLMIKVEYTSRPRQCLTQRQKLRIDRHF